MGKAKLRRKKFFSEHPHCCFCGGTTPATTEDHIPARAFFYCKEWPEGYVFPACTTCNAASRISENTMAAISRCYPEPRDAAEKEEMRRQILGIHNNDINTFNEMTVSGIEKSLIYIGGSLVKAHLDNFANKLIKALHYKHANKIVSSGACIQYKIYTNYELATGAPFPEAFKDLPDMPKIERNTIPLKDQFEYEYGITQDVLRSIFSVRFRQAFKIYGLVDDR